MKKRIKRLSYFIGRSFLWYSPAAKQIVADDQTQENKDKSDDLISDQEYQNHTQRTTEQPKTTNTFHKHTPTGAYIMINVCSLLLKCYASVLFCTYSSDGLTASVKMSSISFAAFFSPSLGSLSLDVNLFTKSGTISKTFVIPS